MNAAYHVAVWVALLGPVRWLAGRLARVLMPPKGDAEREPDR